MSVFEAFFVFFKHADIIHAHTRRNIIFSNQMYNENVDLLWMRDDKKWDQSDSNGSICVMCMYVWRRQSISLRKWLYMY